MASSPLTKSRRKYPRADIEVRARLSVKGDPKRSFQATLATSNISVGGLFIESTFFLKTGTKLWVELELPPQGRTVKVLGQVVRTEESSGKKKGGFALKFIEYFDGSEVILATHFLAPKLKEFILQYAKQNRISASPEYLANMADVLAAWELKKSDSGGDIWSVTGLSAPSRR